MAYIRGRARNGLRYWLYCREVFLVTRYSHCPHCKYCEMNHPYPCEDPTCKEGNTKLKET